MKEDKLSKLWEFLRYQKEKIPLKDAVKKSGLEWNSEGGGGNDDLVDFIQRMRKYQTKKFIRKIMRDKIFQERFITGDDFYHLYLLRKTTHPGIDMLFGVDSTFKLLNWSEMYHLRRKLDIVK